MDKKEIEKDMVNIGSSVTGVLVGLAVGGPPGAIIGATVSPLITMAHGIVARALDRKRERTKRILDQAFSISKLSPEDVINLLNIDDNKTDDFLRLLKVIADSDDHLDDILANLLSQTLISQTDTDRERLLLLGDALKNMRRTHIKIITALKEHSGILPAKRIAQIVNIPEIELRNTVRDLELRGIIEDNGKEPTIWHLRELGIAISEFIKNKTN